MGKKAPSSQVMELFLHVAEQLGLSTDRELAELAGCGADNVDNWRSGAVREFKVQTLLTIKDNLASRITQMQGRARLLDSGLDLGLVHLEVEEGSGPSELARKLGDRIHYDYLGHRFLYYDPQGALAWENLIRGGYAQDAWLRGVEHCSDLWLDRRKNSTGQSTGALSRALGFDRKSGPVGLDIVSLGPGDGDKEVVFLRRLLGAQPGHGQPWINLALVDVSIPLLVHAAKSARSMLRQHGQDRPDTGVLAFCADFEEGELGFEKRLGTATGPSPSGLRLILLLGNVFGNVRDEDSFVRQKLWRLTRPGDLVWLEVGVRAKSLEQDPLYRMTLDEHEETAAENHRRLLLEGPYRRWEAALGRRPAGLEMRIWVREGDDAARIPGSCNFCHDLRIVDEGRVCTMLYSRRYQLEGLTAWFEKRGFAVESIVPVADSEHRQSVAHVLLRRA